MKELNKKKKKCHKDGQQKSHRPHETDTDLKLKKKEGKGNYVYQKSKINDN